MKCLLKLELPEDELLADDLRSSFKNEKKLVEIHIRALYINDKNQDAYLLSDVAKISRAWSIITEVTRMKGESIKLLENRCA